MPRWDYYETTISTASDEHGDGDDAISDDTDPNADNGSNEDSTVDTDPNAEDNAVDANRHWLVRKLHASDSDARKHDDGEHHSRLRQWWRRRKIHGMLRRTQLRIINGLLELMNDPLHLDHYDKNRMGRFLNFIGYVLAAIIFISFFASFLIQAESQSDPTLLEASLLVATLFLPGLCGGFLGDAITSVTSKLFGKEMSNESILYTVSDEHDKTLLIMPYGAIKQNDGSDVEDAMRIRLASIMGCSVDDTPGAYLVMRPMMKPLQHLGRIIVFGDAGSIERLRQGEYDDRQDYIEGRRVEREGDWIPCTTIMRAVYEQILEDKMADAGIDCTPRGSSIVTVKPGGEDEEIASITRVPSSVTITDGNHADDAVSDSMMALNDDNSDGNSDSSDDRVLMVRALSAIHECDAAWDAITRSIWGDYADTDSIMIPTSEMRTGVDAALNGLHDRYRACRDYWATHERTAVACADRTIMVETLIRDADALKDELVMFSTRLDALNHDSQTVMSAVSSIHAASELTSEVMSMDSAL